MPSAIHSPPQEKGASVRVMVVDDSAVVRGYIVRLLEAEPGIEVVATCSNGQSAIQLASRMPIDVIILDIEMPVMDGLTALPKLLEANPAARIVMASTLTQRNAGVSLEALARGATDYLPKPSTSGISTNGEFRRELIDKVVTLGRGVRKAPRTMAAPTLVMPAPQQASTSFKLRSASPSRPQMLVIGSSTGGPQALLSLLTALPQAINAPILIAQHMPPMFTAILAQHIGRAAGRPSAEATDGTELRPGSIYLAPGNFHLEIARDGTSNISRLTQAPPENFCRPSVNPLFSSAARLFGSDVCAVMLTGMGSDGLDGTRRLAAAGAPVIAQDEASSVVWGMPGAIAGAGLCSAVLPLSQIAGHLATIFSGGRR